MSWKSLTFLLAVLAVALAACGDSDDTDSAEDDSSTTTEQSQHTDTVRSLDAPQSDTIVVDGDSSDWAAITGLEMTLEAIAGEVVDPHDATVKIAQDNDNVYVLLEVDDDYDWDATDLHLSGSIAIQWAIESEAAAHMGAEDFDRETSLGMVDLWHWELECGAGVASGGATSGPGADHDPGNDEACNFDDEFATTPEDREDDNSTGGENSLLGVWTHTSPTADTAGTWIFEMSRPLDTGDTTDAQFAAGSTVKLAIAYWDADNSADGWSADEHVQSSNQGWIEVGF